MNRNKLTILIKKPIEDVFNFTTDPDNTHKWIDGIEQEEVNSYPIKIGTIYRNRGKNDKEWTKYEVVEFKKNKLFILRKNDANYHVKYTYRLIDKITTELTYTEWVIKGDLEDPFNQNTLKKLKFIMEN